MPKFIKIIDPIMLLASVHHFKEDMHMLKYVETSSQTVTPCLLLSPYTAYHWV